MREYTVDGSTITDLPSLGEAFAKAVESATGYFGRDLKSFDDCLFGGFGLTAPCRIVWKHSAISRHHLNAASLAQICQAALLANDYLDDAGKQWLSDTKGQAQLGLRTLFDEVVDAIRSVSHRAGTPGWTIELELR